MTNSSLLRRKIDEAGYKLLFIAKQLGISNQGLLNKINNVTEFKASEIEVLRELLKLTDAEVRLIFFNPKVE